MNFFPVAMALHAFWTRKRLWVLQGAGNLALAGLFLLWLTIPEARWWHLLQSAALALFMLFAALYVHGTTLAAFHERDGTVPLRGTVRRLPALLFWLGVLAGTLWVVEQTAASNTARTVGRVAALLVLLPMASQLAARGFQGLRHWPAFLTDWRYFVVAIAILLGGLCAANSLVWWIPAVGGLTAQAVSMGVRWGLAYAILLGAWLLLAAWIGALSLEKIPRKPSL